MEAMNSTTNEADELLRAELAVEQSRAELNRSLRRVSQSSERLLNRVQAELKPGMVVAAVAVGAVALTGALVLLVRRREQKHQWLMPARPSAAAVAAKTLGLWALRLAARSAAQALVARLEQLEPKAEVTPVAHPAPAAE